MEELLKKITAAAEVWRDKKENPVSFLHICASSENEIRLPETKLPYCFLVLSGKIRLDGPDGTREYSAGDYFVSGITTPVRVGVLPSQDGFWAVSVLFEPDEIISVILEMDKQQLDKIFKNSPAEDHLSGLLNCIGELLNLKTSESDKSFLANHLKRGLIFYLLSGKYGKTFIQNTFNLRDAGNIYRINSWIKENYKASFSEEDLARQANMSVSGFHQKFKNAVGMGPIQCQKKLRLVEARKLMLRSGLSVTEASFEVGYESQQQFNREYKRLFGLPPKEHIKELKE